MGFKSNIAGVVARQLGNLQGKLIAQIEGRVSEIVKKFSNECPTPSELEKIIKSKNNLLTTLNSFQKRVASFNGTVTGIESAIRSTKAVITVIKSIPIPTAIIPPMTGGVGLPVSILTRYSDALVLLNRVVQVLEDDVAGVKAVTGSVTETVAVLKKRLETVDRAIETCSKGNPEILLTAQPKENTGSEGVPDSNYLYKGYVLEIIQDVNSPTIAPRRYAIAKDKAGVTVFYGPSSFSSDTQVLLDELKFKIDNQFT